MAGYQAFFLEEAGEALQAQGICTVLCHSNSEVVHKAGGCKDIVLWGAWTRLMTISAWTPLRWSHKHVCCWQILLYLSLCKDHACMTLPVICRASSRWWITSTSCPPGTHWMWTWSPLWQLMLWRTAQRGKKSVRWDACPALNLWLAGWLSCWQCDVADCSCRFLYSKIVAMHLNSLWILNLLWPENAVLQEVNKILEEKFKTGKNRWFFQKLRFWRLPSVPVRSQLYQYQGILGWPKAQCQMTRTPKD